MMAISRVEVLFYGGIAIVIVAIVMAVSFALIYMARKGKLDRTLMDEYGDLGKYNLQPERKPG